MIPEVIISFPGVLAMWSNYHITSTLIVCHFVKLMPAQSFCPLNVKQFKKDLQIKMSKRLSQDRAYFHRVRKRKLKDHRLARCKLGEAHFNAGRIQQRIIYNCIHPKGT